MSLKGQIWLVGFAAGVSMPAAALQDERQRGAVSMRWTAPGWYLVEYRGGGQADLLRAGPFVAQDACLKARSGVEPLPPPGHPELDVMSCRELKQAPAA